MTFPASYPTAPFSVDIPGDQALLPQAVACIKSAIHKYLLCRCEHKEGGSGLLLRPFLHWLDNNICAIVTPQVEQVQIYCMKLFIILFYLIQSTCDPLQPIQPTCDPIQPTSDPIQPTCDPIQPTCDPIQPTSDTLLCAPDPLQTTSDLCAADNNPDYNPLQSPGQDEEHTSFTVQNPIPVKRGTEIRFQELKLSSTIGVVIYERLKLIVRCNRCREMLSTGLLKAEIPTCIRCTRCQTACAIVYHPAVLHTANATCGFLDLER